MNDIAKVQAIIEKVGLSQNFLLNAAITEKQRKDIYDVLIAISKTPLEYEKIFTDRTKRIITSENYDNKEKLTVKLSLEEQQENIKSLLSTIQIIIPKLLSQLKSMQGKGYFIPQEEVTKYETIWLRKPSRGVIGDRGSSYNEPREAVFHKKNFSNKDIEDQLQQLEVLKKSVTSLLKSLEMMKISDNVFAENNIEIAQKQGGEERDKIKNVYRIINAQFSSEELSDNLLETPIKHGGDKYKKIMELIRNKSISASEFKELIENIGQKKDKKNFFGSNIFTREKHVLEKGETLICNIPEVDDLFKISLADTKDIPNPKYLKKKKEIELLESVVNQLKDILTI